MSSLNLVCRRIACTTMVMALFLVAGGHWAMLQGVAWTAMVHDFSRTTSLGEAVSKTFDGKHPCSLCNKITKAKNSETSEDRAPLTLKADKKAGDFVSVAGPERPLPFVRPMVYGPPLFVSMPERFFAPPAPVPIAA